MTSTGNDNDAGGGNGSSSTTDKTRSEPELQKDADFLPFKCDRFGGVVVNSDEEFNYDAKTFDAKLRRSITKWTLDGTKTVWFFVSLTYSKWLPVLSEHDFLFHRVSQNGRTVVMYRWLLEDVPNSVPPYAHTMIGVGGIVFNETADHLLVVEQKFGSRKTIKLPGGYVEPREDLAEAAIREVEEETGIKTIFRSCISFRHSHFGTFDCSDIYFVVHLEPITYDVRRCSDEIVDAFWTPIEQFLNNPQVHELNRFFVKSFLKSRKKGATCIVKKSLLHPILKTPLNVYYIDDSAACSPATSSPPFDDARSNFSESGR